MGDLFVHVRLKECCRKALGEIDGIKKGIGGTGAFKVSLAKILGEKAVPEALTALSTTIGKSAPEGDRRFTGLKKKSCAKAASAHAAVHKGKGETCEAGLWEAIAAVFEGKPVTLQSVTAAHTSSGGAAATQPATAAQASSSGGAPASATPASGAAQAPPYVGLSRFARDRGFDITATTGGTHNPGSAHYEGRAIDVRTNNRTDAEVEAFMRDARAAGIHVRDERTRPPGQQVWTGPHIHLSVPAGTNFP